MDSTTPAKQTAPAFLTITAAAERIGLSRSGVYRLLDNGHLKPADVGGRRMVSTASVVEFIDRALSDA